MPTPRTRVSENVTKLKIQWQPHSCSQQSRKTLVVVANRLPVRRLRDNDTPRWETSPGGLVSALRSVLGNRELCWVGWSGEMGAAPPPFQHDGIQHHPIRLDESDYDLYYSGFANRTLWPLFHDAVRTPEYHRSWWRSYLEVNSRFAHHTARVLEHGGTAWIHDYHLMLVPSMLRALRPDVRISYFLHIPFPPEELFAQIPWRRELLEGVLGSDVVGFQTRLGAQNFSRLARRFTAAAGSEELLKLESRTIGVECFPISIDTKAFEDLANQPAAEERAAAIRAQLGNNKKIFLGVDRLDYTKGIDIRLRAFQTFLERHPDLRDQVKFMQIAVPSREPVIEYQNMRTRIEQIVGNINGRYGKPGQVPVHYMCQSVPPEELVAYYKAADVMVVTPLRDGMNLVAKEYVATRTENDGALILSEFTGAAKELNSALLVNPHDVDGLALMMHSALLLEPAEQQHRMAQLRDVVLQHDVHDWADMCLGRTKN